MSQLFGMVAVLWVEEGQMNQLPEMMAVLWVEEGRMNQLPEMMAVLWMEEGLRKVELISSASEAALRTIQQQQK